MFPASLPGRKRNQGFTLVELLVVVGIMGILAALSVPALHGLSESRSLDSSGNQIVDLVNEARQEAMSKGVMTALVLVTSASNAEWNNRLLILLQLAPGGTAWTPASRWTMLPKGVLVDGSQSTTFTQQSATLPQPLGALSYQGASLPPAAYVCQVFTPAGHILTSGVANPLPPALRLVQGVMNQAAIVSTASANNYYDITLNLYTGTPTIDRP